MDPYLISLSKNNLKWIKDYNILPEIIKTLNENMETLFDTDASNEFLDIVPKEQATEAKTYTWNYIRLTSFCLAK